MKQFKRASLSSFVAELLAKGQTIFTADQAVRSLGVNHGAFLDAAERLQNRQVLLNPRRGFYVAVPQQYASWGAPPPSWYIDDLMRHEQTAYYVGLLKAAELHSATHQAVMEFQVVTSKRLPRIRAGRSLIVFYYRKELGAISSDIESRKTDTGTMKVSSPELTALDLLRYWQASAGIDHVATVLTDLATKIDKEQLASLSSDFEKSVVQRLGYLLEHLDHRSLAQPMHQALFAKNKPRWVELDRKEAKDPDFAPSPIERDARWKVIVRRYPEVDE